MNRKLLLCLSLNFCSFLSAEEAVVPTAQIEESILAFEAVVDKIPDQEWDKVSQEVCAITKSFLPTLIRSAATIFGTTMCGKAIAAGISATPAQVFLIGATTVITDVFNSVADDLQRDEQQEAVARASQAGISNADLPLSKSCNFFSKKDAFSKKEVKAFLNIVREKYCNNHLRPSL